MALYNSISQLERYTIKQENGYWLWPYHKDKDGYGRVGINYKTIRLGKLILSFKLNKPIAEINSALHTCDTPACFNPEHLFEGTHLDNMQDAKKKGRKYIGSKNDNAKLTEEDIIKIRASSKSLKELSKEFKIGWKYVSAIRCKRSWSNVI